MVIREKLNLRKDIFKTVSFHTLGCKLNFSESSKIMDDFINNGYKINEFPKKSDFYVINTCSVTENANKKCRKIIRQIKNLASKSKVIIIGCYAQLKPFEISQIDGVDLVLGASEKFNIINHLDSLDGKLNKVHSCEIDSIKQFVPSFSTFQRKRSFLKIQDGCNYPCTYCTIPLARGKSRSDTINNTLKNAIKLLDNGVNEIVLTGVNIGDFRDNGLDFFNLIKQLDNIGAKRIRISSIEPNLLTNDMIEFISKSNSFVPHFHLPLQSGSDNVLKLMKRRYNSSDYIKKIKFIKKIIPHACIGSDVMVGFPGEKNKDFNLTKSLILNNEISYLHVFSYSDRDNTESSKMLNKISSKEIENRSKFLRKISKIKTRKFYDSCLGKIDSVLIENKDNNYFVGYTSNYIKVKSKIKSINLGELVNVKLDCIENDYMIGKQFY